MKSLLLIRHGQSEWNALGKWQGQADPPLTALGHQQAAAAAITLGSLDASKSMQVVGGSTLIRARDTATTIAEKLGLAAPTLYPELVERDAGEWSGLTKDEINEQYPGYLRSGRRPSGYESDEALLPRVLAGLRTVAADMQQADHDRTAVVVHCGVIYVLEEHFGESFQRIGNLGSRELRFADDNFSLGERIELLGDEIEATVPDQI